MEWEYTSSHPYESCKQLCLKVWFDIPANFKLLYMLLGIVSGGMFHLPTLKGGGSMDFLYLYKYI